MRRVDQINGSPIATGRGKSRKTIFETIEKDFDFNGLSIEMTYDKIL